VSNPTCTCWRFPTLDGQVLPLRFVCLHDEVHVTTRGGEHIKGWSYGAQWIRTPDGPVCAVEVEPRGGDVVHFLKEAIATVTPIGGYTDHREFLDAVASLVDRMAPGEPEEYVHLLVGDHETVQVTVKKESHPCAPPT
jgi:hypothetical protein